MDYFSNERNLNSLKPKLGINCCNIFQIFIFGFGSFTLFCLRYLNLSNPVRYVTFNTNLSIYRKKNIEIESLNVFGTFYFPILSPNFFGNYTLLAAKTGLDWC